MIKQVNFSVYTMKGTKSNHAMQIIHLDKPPIKIFLAPYMFTTERFEIALWKELRQALQKWVSPFERRSNLALVHQSFYCIKILNLRTWKPNRIPARYLQVCWRRTSVSNHASNFSRFQTPLIVAQLRSLQRMLWYPRCCFEKDWCTIWQTMSVD